MTRTRFLLTLAAFVASIPQLADAQETTSTRYQPPPVTKRPGGVRGGPAPVLGAGLPAIVVAGGALAGYRLWRRRRQSSEGR
jgi:hypothetical protein